MEISTTTIASILAVAISAVALGWNIYRDAIRRPRFRTSIAIKSILQEGKPARGPFVFVEALNMGPLPNRIGFTFARKSWFKRYFLDRTYSGAFIYPDYRNPATTPASTRLEVGDSGSFAFQYDKDCFLKEDFSQIGVADGFGKVHWAPRNQLKNAQEKYQKDFVPFAKKTN